MKRMENSSKTTAEVEEEKRVGKRTKSVRFAIEEESETISNNPTPQIAASDVNLPTEAEPRVASPDQTAALDPAIRIDSTELDPIDEDEWAAFERDLATITQAPKPSSRTQEDKYALATISAPAVSAAELAQRQKQTKRSQSEPESTAKVKRRDYEAEAQEEREEEEARMTEEFAVMEEMEEKVRRLREMREKLRLKNPPDAAESSNSDLVGNASAQDLGEGNTISKAATAKVEDNENVEDDSDDEGDEMEDWFS